MERRPTAHKGGSRVCDTTRRKTVIALFGTDRPAESPKKVLYLLQPRYEQRSDNRPAESLRKRAARYRNEMPEVFYLLPAFRSPTSGSPPRAHDRPPRKTGRSYRSSVYPALLSMGEPFLSVFSGDFLAVHRSQELHIVGSLFHAFLHKFHRFHRVHVGQVLA